MLSKQVHKKHTRKAFMLNTKQRSLQVARHLWTNTKDVEHSRECAVLTAKLIGFVEPGQVPKEIFGLSFSPQPINRKPFVWRQHVFSIINF
ncbi:hypothetical protein L484_016018 [Morus notabilis]|uniref:NPK1-activating kinesin-like protein C-terminal domain-containing protein n=1 Tax=Morus notabilis TaxID=981085 RepID=W9RML5_9ROSA|nr:hypothetical protein L484_016018 [Morus notabilis]